MGGLDSLLSRQNDLMSVLSDDEPPVHPQSEQIEPEEEIVIRGEAGFTDLVVAVFCGSLLRGE